MKTLMIKCPDGYDDIVAVTLIGTNEGVHPRQIVTNATNAIVNLHKYNYLTFNGYHEPIMYWQNGRNDENEQ